MGQPSFPVGHRQAPLKGQPVQVMANTIRLLSPGGVNRFNYPIYRQNSMLQGDNNESDRYKPSYRYRGPFNQRYARRSVDNTFRPQFPRALYQQRYNRPSSYSSEHPQGVFVHPRNPDQYKFSTFRQRYQYPMLRYGDACFQHNQCSTLTTRSYGDELNYFQSDEDNSSSSASVADEETSDDAETGISSEDVLLPLVPLPSTSSIADQELTGTAHITVVSKYVLVGKQKTELRAAFGVWLGEGNPLNFGGIMPLDRLQCRKAALIYSGAACVILLKEKGFNHVKICMESDYLVKNVTAWLYKSGLNNPGASNWDEFKFSEEIGLLCGSFSGMKINWVHVTEKCESIDKAAQLAAAALPKDYQEVN
ncbi:uncharacterized protein LOC110863121 isoform X2 [Folsomia candida]|uniref:uncharacterized protein LOC110863121 isoform X2 n=1 Tax=Folsomia candida TaxID=158441 RepID=UPI0016051B21|nr:uncharacterized protein LOC110863121 isoform X2 [Folsomia candida]